MMGSKLKTINNKNKGYFASPEPNSSTIASPGYTITLEITLGKQDSDLKSLLMIMIKDFKKDIKHSLKEIQENPSKQVEALKEETQKTPKELTENTITQVKEMNKTIKHLKMELETIKKSQRETIQELVNLRKRSGIIDTSIINRIQEIEERISGAKDTIENIETTAKENAKFKKVLTQNIQEIQDTISPNLRIISIEESEDSQIKESVNNFIIIIEENVPNLKREMPMYIQEAYRTANKLYQKTHFSYHIIIKTPNALSKY
jgi:chromosome segregation ATPase